MGGARGAMSVAVWGSKTVDLAATISCPDQVGDGEFINA